MKKGLVMEGGGMRGMFTVGVLDVLMENNIEFDGAIGVSAGAVFGCNLKSKQIGRAIRYNERFCNDKRFCSIRSLIKTGDMFGSDFCYHELPAVHDIFDIETYAENPMPFYVVCTDVNTGKAVYKDVKVADYNGLEWFRASASMPLASRIVQVDGYNLLDGGMADSVPIKYFESIGYDRNIIILTQPENYTKKKNSLMPLIKLAYRKYPEMTKTMSQRHIVYNETTEYIKSREKNGEILVIRPEGKLDVGRTEHKPHKLREAYNAGRKTAEKMLPEIKKFLSE